MYKIGENVVYGANGVMTVHDIREETIGDVSRSYYVLRPYGSRGASYTFVPTDSEQLTSQMLPLLSREEIIGILHERNKPEIEWKKDNRARAEYFKAIMESGDRRMIVAMIEAIYLSGRRRVEEGKKNFLSDENLMRKAEKIIHSEFSIVLGIPESEVPAFIENECGGEG